MRVRARLERLEGCLVTEPMTNRAEQIRRAAFARMSDEDLRLIRDAASTQQGGEELREEHVSTLKKLEALLDEEAARLGLTS